MDPLISMNSLRSWESHLITLNLEFSLMEEKTYFYVSKKHMKVVSMSKN